jgi:hypothetical protein
VFLATLGAEEFQIEASFCAAIRTAKEQKSVSLEKRAEATYAEYRRQKAGDMVVYCAGFPANYGRQPLYFQDPTFAARAAVLPPKDGDSSQAVALPGLSTNPFGIVLNASQEVPGGNGIYFAGSWLSSH